MHEEHLIAITLFLALPQRRHFFRDFAGGGSRLCQLVIVAYILTRWIECQMEDFVAVLCPADEASSTAPPLICLSIPAATCFLKLRQRVKACLRS